MSSKHRHGLPRKRPGRSKREAIDAEMPTLEPVEGEPTLEPVDDGPVSITCEGGEVDADTEAALVIDVPEMEKKAVQGAVEGPLGRAVEQYGSRLRFRDVVVRFTGDALIGSAMKDVVKEAVAPAKPTKITVKRGFGDEVVHESEMPKLGVQESSEANGTQVAIDASGFEAGDLPRFLGPVLTDLAGKASGAKFTFKFSGGAKPDSELRQRIGDELQEAGAVRVAVGARVLFDRELTDRCLVEESGDVVIVTIDPAADPAITGEAMETVMPDHALGLAGRTVRVHWRSEPGSGEGDHFVRLVSQFAPEHIEFVRDGEPEVVWPGVLEVVAGKREVTLRVRPHGRSHTRVLELLPQECADLENEIQGKNVVVDWPKLFVVDDDTEGCLIDTFGKLGAERVSCTVAGEDREPFLPPPVVCTDADGRCHVTIDTDAGKPAEVVRAIERAVPRFADRISGKPARIVIAGDGVPSRTLHRAALDRVAAAGPSRLEFEDHGPVDILLPPMLEIGRDGGSGVKLGVDLAGRDADQRGRAIEREFGDGALPADAEVTLAGEIADDVREQLLAALIERGVLSVTGADGTQLYPEVLPEPEPEPLPEPEPEPEAEEVAELPAPEAAGPAEVVAEPAAAAAAVAPSAPVAAGEAGVRVLGRNDDGIPPTVLLGIDNGTDAAHLAAIEQQLVASLPKFARRGVMVVLQQGGVDVPVRKTDAMVDLLGRVLPQTAAATMLFRGPDAQGRPHFQVIHSSLRALPVGANFRDPRS
ncbi:MAG: hypothetical protein NXI31_14495 [bacterium]|nr:hypothetical protein [bacterium]